MECLKKVIKRFNQCLKKACEREGIKIFPTGTKSHAIIVCEILDTDILDNPPIIVEI